MRGTAAVAGMVASLGFAAPAWADVKSGSVSDRRGDAPTEVDVERLAATHDSVTGELRIVIGFAPGWSGSTGPGAWLDLTLDKQCGSGGRYGFAINKPLRAAFNPAASPMDVWQSGNHEVTIYYYKDADYKGIDIRCASSITLTAGEEVEHVTDFRMTAEHPQPPVHVTTKPPPLPIVTTPEQGTPTLDATGTLTAGTPGPVRLTGSARLRRGLVRVRIACTNTGRARLLVRSRRLAVRRIVRCRSGRIAVRRIRVERRLRAVRVVVTMGGERVSVRLRR